MSLSRVDRARGALAGLFIGDALAMPVHWYYNRQALQQDYGTVRSYLAPRNPHPDSILWRSRFENPGPGFDILHDQRRYWGQAGIHYHQFLQAGENTLNLKCARLLIDSLRTCGGYDADDYLHRYITFMTTPGRHRDTYVEEYHRHFFSRLAAGHPPRQCGIPEHHIGGLVGIVPVVVFFRNDPAQAMARSHEHLTLTHRGKQMTSAAALLTEVLLKILDGQGLKRVLEDGMASQAHPYFGYPFKRWLRLPDQTVIGNRLSSACYVEDALPAVVYLAWKYAHDPEAGLIANTHLGGDNAHRGALLGALFGADGGQDAFPGRWLSGLDGSLPNLP